MAMRKSAFTEGRIALAPASVGIRHGGGRDLPEAGVTQATFCRWKKTFAGMGVSEVRRSGSWRKSTRKLKQLVADLSLDKHMLQEIVRKSTEAGSQA
jgi:putative transposase